MGGRCSPRPGPIGARQARSSRCGRGRVRLALAMAGPVDHPLFARFESRLAALELRTGGEKLWHELLDGLSGRVVDVGPGSGIGFAYYPREATEVLAVEPEAYMRSQAEEAASKAPVPVRVVDGLADSIPAEDGTFDAAVTGRVLCSVPDQAAAVAE